MNDLYTPLIHHLDNNDWGKCDDEQKKEFLNMTIKFSTELEEALKSLSSGLDICKLDHEYLAGFNNENDKISYYEDCFDKWISSIKSHLDDDTSNRREAPDAGKQIILKIKNLMLTNFRT